ncbi:uncharacterized protein BHQ10_002864 [Talaromyces amestolkiae]|uniref:Probable beta-glucosidase G n=1 Tax=Talaromyces amestolkiae TaxID=1196081 RepID=A0A364KTH7_TALAM|nr:uncharacterized protein BHQ10_002864 [Talaromyces amestolkiae]RAO66852.1 hypothetical protein BHQ10_002864 [Talaromyces amestolkiae]
MRVLNLSTTAALYGVLSATLAGSQIVVPTIQGFQPTIDDWKAARAKADAFVGKLTLDEKLAMVRGNASAGFCSGTIAAIERLDFPGVCMEDGPNGVNYNDKVNVFPSGVTVAATWDTEFMYQRGLALGAEFRDKGINVMLGPVGGPLGRSPYDGRTWEGFSPDPYLTGLAMQATIQGVQENGVQTTAKHFIGNEQETQRSNTTLSNGTQVAAISSNIGDRALHELYLWPFANAVKAGTSAVMCSYNRLNETYACENSDALISILKTELGFEGYVVSDWGATHSAAPSANGGLDLEMPGYTGTTEVSTWFIPYLPQAIADGSVSIDRLDDMVGRIMTPYYLLNQDAGHLTPDESMIYMLLVATNGLPGAEQLSSLVGVPWQNIAARDVRGIHGAIIREIGAEATVLLKNEGSILPLGSYNEIGVFGSSAADFVDGLAYWDMGIDYGPQIGPIAVGGGSGSVRFTTVSAPLDAIKAQASTKGARVQYLTNNTAIAANDITFYPVPEICIVFISQFATEASDRDSLLASDNSTAVVENVASLCNNTIVVINAPGPLVLPWVENPNVKAILAAHFPGDQIGNSIVDVLWGNTEPSGRLPYTIPAKTSDPDIIPVVREPGPDGWQSTFTEGLFIDYRAYDANRSEPAYEFGFGLGYTTFNITGELAARTTAFNPTATPANSAIAPGGNPSLWDEIVSVKATILNVGKATGKAVPQLYLEFPESSPEGTPVRVLRGFAKLQLDPGKEGDVQFSLMRRDLSYWDIHEQQWVIPTGAFTVNVGFSSRDLRASTQVTVLK